MFANMTSVKTDRGSLEDEAQMAADALLPWVRQFDGYRGMIVLSNGENGTARFVTFWEDRDALERSERGRMQVREQMAKTAGAEIDDVQAYTVLLVDGFE
jgi:heme-degrading monooxygenase HmoA